MQAEAAQPLDDGRHARGVRHGLVRIRAARRLRRIDAGLAAHVVHPFGAIVVRRQRLVVDGPRGRNAVAMLDGLEVLAAQPVEHAAPELRVAADVVVRVGPELAAAFVEPALLRLIAQVLPDRLRIPVLRFLGNEIAPLEHEDARPGLGKRVRHRPAARAAPDDDDVVALGHAGCPMRCVDLFHQLLILDRPLEAHLGLRADRGSIATKSRYIAR